MKIASIVVKFVGVVYRGLVFCLALGVEHVSRKKIPLTVAKKCIYLGTATAFLGMCIAMPLFVIDMALILVYLFIVSSAIEIIVDLTTAPEDNQSETKAKQNETHL